MRSATPKHLHQILGRRMVDWVVEAARPLGAEPLVVVVHPRRSRRSPGSQRWCRSSRAAPATRSAAREAALAGAEEVLVLSGTRRS